MKIEHDRLVNCNSLVRIRRKSCIWAINFL